MTASSTSKVEARRRAREATKRRAGTRAEAGAAVRLLQENGETLTTIAELTGDGIGEVRAMLRHAPKIEKRTARNGSHSLDGDGSADPAVSPGDGAGGVPDAATART